MVLLLHVYLQGQTHAGQGQEAVEECHREGETAVTQGKARDNEEGKGEFNAVLKGAAHGTVVPSSRCMPLRMSKLMKEGGPATLKGYVTLYRACKALQPLPPQHYNSPPPLCTVVHPQCISRQCKLLFTAHAALQVTHASPVLVHSPVAHSTPAHIDDINRIVMETIERSRSHPEHVSLAAVAANRSRSPHGPPRAVHAHRHVLREDSESSDDGGGLLPRARVGRELASENTCKYTLHSITE